MTEQIKIQNITTKQNPSKFQPGQFYTIATIIDEKGRELTAMGKWAESWKVGDTISAIVEQNQWTDRQGQAHTSLKLKNPNPSTNFQKSGYSKDNTMIDYYDLAIKAMSVLANKEAVTLDYIHKCAEAIKTKIEGNTQAPQQQNTMIAQNTQQPAAQTVQQSVQEEVIIEEDTDLKPF